MCCTSSTWTPSFPFWEQAEEQWYYTYGAHQVSAISSEASSSSVCSHDFALANGKMDPTKSKQTFIFNLFFGVSKGKN